jgi:hypothetical protein
MNDPATMAHQVRGLLVETLNQYAPLEPHLTKDFDVWAFENDSGEILQVAWNADGYIDLSRPDPS